jgi:hypothetical protein
MDLFVILAPRTAEEDASLVSENDRTWSYQSGGRVGDWSTIELEWGRATGSTPFQVEISVNDTVVARRIPPEIRDGHLGSERVFVFRLIRDTSDGDRNQLRVRSLSPDSYLVRTIAAGFFQDF